MTRIIGKPLEVRLREIEVDAIDIVTRRDINHPLGTCILVHLRRGNTHDKALLYGQFDWDYPPPALYRLMSRPSAGIEETAAAKAVWPEIRVKIERELRALLLAGAEHFHELLDEDDLVLAHRNGIAASVIEQ